MRDYGEIENSLMLKIYADDLTFNELKLYAKNKKTTSNLQMETIRVDASEYIRLITSYIKQREHIKTKL